MDTITREELRSLGKPSGELCVSLYLPVGRAADARAAAAIRLKDLARVAEASLLARDMRPATARQMLQRVHDLIEEKMAGVKPCEGLALFATQNEFQVRALPFPVEELAWVGNRFCIRPLVAGLARDDGLWVLAVSQKRVRLYRGGRESLVEVHVPDLPANLADVLPEHPEAAKQVHTAKGGHDKKKDAVFHGQGGAVDHEKEDLLRYFYAVDAAVRAFLHDDRRPLVFAGVDYLFPLYQRVNSYAHLTADHVSGNPDLLSAAELHQRARGLLAPSVKSAESAALLDFVRLVAAGAASDNVHEILSAAVEGRVKSLFVVQSAPPLWGTFDTQTNAVAVHPRQTPTSEDLLDRACVEVIAHGGDVHVTDKNGFDGKGGMGAIFRYVSAAASAGQGATVQ